MGEETIFLTGAPVLPNFPVILGFLMICLFSYFLKEEFELELESESLLLNFLGTVGLPIMPL